MDVIKMMNLLFAFVFALLVAVFAVQNALPVTVSFLMWSFQTSLVIIILGAATFGALTILSLSMLVQFKLKRSLNKLNQSKQQLEAENLALRATKEMQAESQKV
jgi:lipopolysaccharide assembly protein A